MKSSSILAAVAAVAASATIPMAANADTVITNGVTWRYVVNDATKKTVTLGEISGFDSTTAATDSNRAMPANTAIDASLIPWTFDVDGETYTVTALSSSAFNGCTKLTGVVSFPSAVKTLGRSCFSSTKVRIASFNGLTTVYGYGFGSLPAQPFPAMPNVATFGRGAFYGATFTGTVRFSDPNVIGSWKSFMNAKGVEAILAVDSTKTFNVDQMADGATNMKVIFMGPRTKGSSLSNGNMLSSVTGCKVYVPTNGDWDGLVTGGSNNEIIYYGASTNLDFSVDDAVGKVVATPTTEEALVKALVAAPLFKTHFGWDMKVETTNAIDVTVGTLTSGMFANAGVKAGSLMLNFAVKTQAQLNDVLAAVPAAAMVGIDPTGLTENMVVTDRENVFVKNVPGVTVRRRAKGGFTILVLKPDSL